jgi:hypothetical protein
MLARHIDQGSLGGVILLAAGIFQQTSLKNACLKHCRTPVSFLMEDWREGAWGAFAMGLEHGSYCTVCCWALMALMFVAGVRILRPPSKTVIGEGDSLVVRGYIQGTHTGQSMNLQLPPTGRQMKVPFCTVTHWKNDKIIEEFTYVDLLLMARQLGAIPSGSMESR